MSTIRWSFKISLSIKQFCPHINHTFTVMNPLQGRTLHVSNLISKMITQTQRGQSRLSKTAQLTKISKPKRRLNLLRKYFRQPGSDSVLKNPKLVLTTSKTNIWTFHFRLKKCACPPIIKAQRGKALTLVMPNKTP